MKLQNFLLILQRIGRKFRVVIVYYRAKLSLKTAAFNSVLEYLLLNTIVLAEHAVESTLFIYLSVRLFP